MAWPDSIETISDLVKGLRHFKQEREKENRMTFMYEFEAVNAANWINQLAKNAGMVNPLVVAQPWEDGWEVVDYHLRTNKG
jgi:hypothetical protein